MVPRGNAWARDRLRLDVCNATKVAMTPAVATMPAIASVGVGTAGEPLLQLASAQPEGTVGGAAVESSPAEDPSAVKPD